MTRRCLLALAFACLVLPGCAADQTAAATLPADVRALPATDVSGFHEILAQQVGTPVVVNIWASWCIPCREETPELVEAHGAFGDRVRFIGVNALDDRGGATGFIDRYGVPYPSVFDPSNAIAVSYGLYGPPATLFFDSTGELVATVPGQISRDDLRAHLRDLVAPAS